MNKIIFITQPDTIQGPCFALKNYDNDHIKKILNTCDHSVAFYLIDDNSPTQWLHSVIKQSKIIFDCSQSSIEDIVKHAK